MRGRSTVISYKTNFAGIVRPSQGVLRVREDRLLATGIEEGRPRKRHTTERLYSGISHLPGASRDLFTYPATRRSQCLDFMYTEGYVALLKPFSDNTSLSVLFSSTTSRMQTPLCFLLYFALCMYVATDTRYM